MSSTTTATTTTTTTTTTNTVNTNQLVCVKRAEPSLSTVFEEMYLNERLVDVTLSCSDGQIQAHKLVLAASSPYFSSLFDKLANPFHYPVIVMKDMRIKDLKLIVDFMYRGQLTLAQEKLTSLIKCAENLQITGLTDSEGTVQTAVGNGTNSTNGARTLNQRLKRNRKSSSSMNLNQHYAVFGRTYNSRHDDLDSRLNHSPDKLLEQSMITGESIDDPSHQFGSYVNHTDPTSTRNLNSQLHTPSPSSINLHHLSSSHIDQQSQQQHQLTNQLQVLSHSLSANRSSLTHATANSHHGQQSSLPIVPQQPRGRVHPCNICWKTFREKANLKRHLQVHSLDRIIYACPDCNKTFSWKDNYIRHTKTAHHLNNVRPST